MVELYLIFFVVFRTVQAIFNKRTSLEIQNLPMLFSFSAYQNAISTLLGLILILLTGNRFSVDWITFLIAVLAGVSLFFSGVFGIYALQSGTISVNAMFSNAGMLIPIVAGVLFFDQPVSWMQMVGVGLFFVSAYLLIMNAKTVYTRFSYKTVLLLVGSLAANGCTMLAQQMFTTYVPDGDVSVFSFLSFGIVVVGSVLLSIKPKAGQDTQKVKTSLSKGLLIAGAALAVCVFFINQLVTLSTALLPPVILFSFLSGSTMIVSAVVAAVAYKERLNLRTIMGVLIGIASLIIIKMFG